jgi:hypothetical protein
MAEGRETPPLLRLPPELLESILRLVRPDLGELLALAQVCSSFRRAAFNVPVALHIPISDGRLKLMANRQIPVSSLCNREHVMFIKYQILQLNVRRLEYAELVSNDYVRNKCELCPHFIEVLHYIMKHSASSLRSLIVNLDLVRNRAGELRSAVIVCTFKNLTFLSITFTNRLELQQRILRQNQAQVLIRTITDNLKKLATLYIHYCPTDELIIHSESLVRLHIYRSDFVAIKELRAPKLQKLMFQSSLLEFFNQARRQSEEGKSLHKDIFKILYDGCPQLESFNTVEIGCLREHNLSREEWCYYALKLCLKKYRLMFGPATNT